MVVVWTDSGFAGCRRTGKSTSDGCVMLDRHVTNTWGTTQTVISLPPGEAEYYSIVKGASVALGIDAMFKDFGIERDINLKRMQVQQKGDPAEEVWVR
jgi:hypothetical protein